MRICLYFLFLIVTSAGFSQNKAILSEKEYHNLQEKFKANIGPNIDSAFIYVGRMEASNNPSHKAYALGSKAYLFQLTSKSTESKKAYDAAFSYLDKVPASKEKIKLNAYLLNLGGLIDWKKTDYSEALIKYQKGKKLSQSIHDYAQILKFNGNIALINGEVGNFKSAISASLDSDKLFDYIKYMISDEQFIRERGLLYTDLGSYYQKYYYRNTTKRQFLDSAEYFYKKAILYSKGNSDIKSGAQTNLGSVYLDRKDYVKAEKTFYDLLLLTKENGLTQAYSIVNFNLGRLYIYTKKYHDALTCFQRVDSIYKLDKTNVSGFIDSNYYQAIIYNSFKNSEKAYQHSKVYLDAFEKNESKMNNEFMEVNYAIGMTGHKNEMVNIQKNNRNAIVLKNVGIALIVILFIILLFILFRNVKKRKGVEEKITALIAEHRANLEKKDDSAEMLYSGNGFNEEEGNNKSSLLNIDEEKEDEIIKKLIHLEKKLQYLNADFTQQAVAKKIKTNTTYLSYVVNKRFGKTFSEYVNELKMNYVINEMISNPTFRKYSTQAMAESVGYKNAVSFTKTFSKRTGVTPVQFIKRLESDDAVTTV